MNFRNLYRILFLYILANSCLSCAQPGSPTGGEKDTIPPEVVTSFPVNETVNFNSSTIEIEFSELIQLKDAQNQILISPTPKEKPKYSFSKKKLLVELGDSLAANTTYSINFGESIVDYTEGNILKNFTYAFATGDQLDSLELKGKAVDAFSGEPIENLKVQLYRNHIDSIPLLEKPDFFVQTDKEGNWKLKYLPDESFKVFGLLEQDGDFLYNDFSENIAFLKKPVDIALAFADTIVLKVFNEEADLGFVDKVVSDSLGTYNITFSKSQKSLAILDSNQTEIQYEWADVNKQSLKTYLPNERRIVLKRSDKRFSNREELLDTLELEQIALETVSDFSKNIILEYVGESKIKNNSVLEFSSSKTISFDSIQVNILLKDSLIKEVFSSEPNGLFGFNSSVELEKDQNYMAEILPGSVKNDQFTNRDTLNFKFSTFPDAHFGELLLEIESELENPLIIVQETSGKILYQEQLKTSTLTLSEIPPGDLEIFLIDDKDTNGEWTTGNYLLGISPENKFKFPQEVSLRSNWSMSFIWIIPN